MNPLFVVNCMQYGLLSEIISLYEVALICDLSLVALIRLFLAVFVVFCEMLFKHLFVSEM